MGEKSDRMRVKERETIKCESEKFNELERKRRKCMKFEKVKKRKPKTKYGSFKRKISFTKTYFCTKYK